MMRLGRGVLVQVLKNRFVSKRRQIELLYHKLLPFDAFKQEVFALLELNEWEWKKLVAESHAGYQPRVGVVVPVYKIPLQQVIDQINSLASQTYPVESCYIIVNSNPEDHYHRELHDRLQQYVKSESFRGSFPDCDTEFIIQYQPRRGKRWAMHKGFRESIKRMHEITINIDGDTFLHDDAISNVVHIFAKTDYVAFSGDVRVANARTNTLTMLTALRYFYASWNERAAQSVLKQTTCLSGPFLAIRTRFLALFLDRWVNQIFLGQECTYGDDRHVSTLLLLEGYSVGFHPDSTVWTDAPTDLVVWLKQQLRWSKSGHRENWLLWVSDRKQALHPFIWVSLAYLSFFPFLVAGVLSSILARTIMALVSFNFTLALEIFGPYFAIIIVANFVFNGLYGWLITKDRRFGLVPLYIGLYFGFLIWVKMYALIRLKDTSWGTK